MVENDLSALSPILVFGAQGQVGSALMSLLGKDGVGFTRYEADFSHLDSVVRILETVSPRSVINAAAYTAVDKAEQEEDLALQVNALAPQVIAKFCEWKNIPLVHFSTDYVFNGQGNQPWVETDPVAPLNAYGRTKYEGEQLIGSSGCRHLILRTSWVYDASGRNFLTTMLRLGKERRSLRVVADQFGAPTYAYQLAQATLGALYRASSQTVFPTGIFHLCHGGETSWYHFAQAIFKHARQAGLAFEVESIDAITSNDYPTPAKRPGNSRLNCDKIKRQLGIELPSWQEGLSLCMKEFA